jgi:NADP-dependent aldehyde dehydrogenase
MELHGCHLIGDERSRACQGSGFHAKNPATGEVLEPEFVDATPAEIHQALELAAEAGQKIERLGRTARAALLERVGDEIMSLGDALLERCHQETGLPMPRLTMERGRTVNQLRLFASVVSEGSYVEARIDRAEPGRTPVPKPDIRRMQVPLGPIVVFGASNFPFAFSVAGGDTASALAAGCPVVVKGHPHHPGTSELVAGAVQAAVKACGFPPGTFSFLQGAEHEVGLTLVEHGKTAAVAFTGSQAGGLALQRASHERRHPVPVYAEMGSVNPVVVLPHAARVRAGAIATGLAQSVLLGAGQFCTNPGLVLALDDDGTADLVDHLAALLVDARSGVFLHEGIRRGFDQGCGRLASVPGVHQRGTEASELADGSCDAIGTLFTTDSATFRANPQLQDEVFGPATLVVTCASPDDLLSVVSQLEGQLTATIHAEGEDLDVAAGLFAALRDRAGRLILNGFPTGVEVCPAMHHGGPFPATTDPRSTSVGTAAIRRFLRPTCFQGFPQELLPPELRDANPEHVLRLIDGAWSRE